MCALAVHVLERLAHTKSCLGDARYLGISTPGVEEPRPACKRVAAGATCTATPRLQQLLTVSVKGQWIVDSAEAAAGTAPVNHQHRFVETAATCKDTPVTLQKWAACWSMRAFRKPLRGEWTSLRHGVMVRHCELPEPCAVRARGRGGKRLLLAAHADSRRRPVAPLT
jgi:hypothetical protein